jgi:hypothetical protein
VELSTRSSFGDVLVIVTSQGEVLPTGHHWPEMAELANTEGGRLRRYRINYTSNTNQNKQLLSTNWDIA